MHFSYFFAVGAALVSCAQAQTLGSTRIGTTTTKVQAATSVPVISETATAVASPCRAISSLQRSWSARYPDATSGPYIKPSVALQCLKEVPLSVNRSSAYVDYVKPYIQFQSTLGYLKDPPKGYTLPGVDVLGGMDTIKQNVQTGVYKDQWSFEKDMYSIINILPHDFHFNLRLPLIDVFAFRTFTPLVSISEDGSSLPVIYLKDDLDEVAYARSSLNWKPSPVTKINGEDASTYIQKLALQSSPFQDPDAQYNNMFYSIPNELLGQGTGNNYDFGAFIFGFDTDSQTYTHANGTTSKFLNIAYPIADFNGIVDGPSLFNTLEVLPTTDIQTLLNKRELLKVKKRVTPLTKRQSQTTLPGYPEPIVYHSGGYVAGFLIPNTELAVLTMAAFSGTNDSAADTDQEEQQAVIEEFLKDCKQAKKTKLIVDLSINGGGYVFSGFDAFKQLFPSIVPYGASRMRSTPLVQYFGDIFSQSGVYNKTFNPVYTIASASDKDNKKFPTWADMGGPFTFHGDNFLAITRPNMSDPIMTGGFSVSGYQKKQTIASAAFTADNIVMLMDGACGSTCTIFAEMMKAQAGVRTVVVGGRPQTGPQQGIGGSKGSQVIKYAQVEDMRDDLKRIIPRISSKNLPSPPAAAFVPPDLEADAPLGSKANLILTSRINLRNTVEDGDADQTPTQFKYEAANCRLFYQPADIYDYSQVWGRVFNVTWGGAKCVSGSTSKSDNTMGSKTTDAVAYSDKVNTAIVLPAQPGLIAIGSTPGTGAGNGFVGSSSNGTSGDKKKNLGGRIESSTWALAVVGAVAFCML